MAVRNFNQMALASLPTCFALSSLSNGSASSSSIGTSSLIAAVAGVQTQQARPRTIRFPAHALSSVTYTTTSKAEDPALSSGNSGLLGRRMLLGGLVVGTEAAFHRFNGTGGNAFASAAVKEKSIHDFTVKDNSGKDVDLSIYKGKVLLVVNVASQCGLTAGNYGELTELHKKYRNQGFEILAFPCNQFGGQEPGTNEQIKEFACSRFKAEFPIFDKVDVNGPRTSPVYGFLKASKEGILGNDIKWNFGKFLVDKNGQVAERYAPTISPLQIESDIKRLLTT